MLIKVVEDISCPIVPNIQYQFKLKFTVLLIISSDVWVFSVEWMTSFTVSSVQMINLNINTKIAYFSQF